MTTNTTKHQLATLINEVDPAVNLTLIPQEQAYRQEMRRTKADLLASITTILDRWTNGANDYPFVTTEWAERALEVI